MPKSHAETPRRIPTSVVHAVGTGLRFSPEEIIVPVHVHGRPQGIRLAPDLARQFCAEIERALRSAPPTGRLYVHNVATFGPL